MTDIKQLNDVGYTKINLSDHNIDISQLDVIKQEIICKYETEYFGFKYDDESTYINAVRAFNKLSGFTSWNYLPAQMALQQMALQQQQMPQQMPQEGMTQYPNQQMPTMQQLLVVSQVAPA